MQKRPYVKRPLQTFQFKGRPRRALLWRKAIYKEWFEYARIAGVYPTEFGDLSKFTTFEEWWRHPTFGFELFCEPVEEPPLQEVTSEKFKIELFQLRGGLIVALNLESHPEKIIQAVKSLLRKKQSATPSFASKARFQPSRPMKHIKIMTIERYRLAYTLQKDGWTRQRIKDYFEAKGMMKKDSYLREVTRDIANARKIIQRVKKGIFP